VKLENKLTKEVREVRVIIADSKQGYLGSVPTGNPNHFDWEWYPLSKWEEVKA